MPTDPEAVSEDNEPPCQQVVHVEGLDSGTVVGIAFAAFVIGVLLTAALWFIHTHTGYFLQFISFNSIPIVPFKRTSEYRSDVRRAAFVFFPLTYTTILTTTRYL